MPKLPRVHTPERVSVTYVITGLNLGGAERMLHRLASSLDPAAFDPRVIALTDAGVMAERIRASGVPVAGLQMRSGMVRPADLRRLGALLRTPRPHVVHTWLHAADLLGGVLARALTSAKVIWSLRGIPDAQASRRHEYLTALACARLSGVVPDRIISCSERLVEEHVALGYAPDGIEVIPNGFDVDALQPDPRAAELRARLAPGRDGLLVGVPARFNPQKDHATLLAAAAALRAEGRRVTFVLAGPGVHDGNADLVALIRRHGVADDCVLVGAQDDMRGFMSGVDLVVSSSRYGEGFSNVLGEAMACGTPCVATDVGDARLLIADTGLVVPKADPPALAQAIAALADADRAELGARARARIVERFSMPSVVRRYEQAYREVLAR
jgi:glycosyltransferase involved in cell wall biosynthesis